MTAVAHVVLTVNGEEHAIDVDPQLSLADVLRDRLRLTGTHIGCRTGNCGACTVIMDGAPVKSCCVLAGELAGQRILTIEGLSGDEDELHVVQQAFADTQGLQCGFCTPAMILSAVILLEANREPTEDDIRTALAGNLCRCTGYQLIVESVRVAASRSQVRDAGGGTRTPDARLVTGPDSQDPER